MSPVLALPEVMKQVFWGNALPRIIISVGGSMVTEWSFASTDNFRMELRCRKVVDSQAEMASGIMRQRVRGYRLVADFEVKNVNNRSLLMFLRNMFVAETIILIPHYGGMANPNDGSYEFRMITDGDWEPLYTEGRFIGHTVSFRLIGVDLLRQIPTDPGRIGIVKATTTRVDGVEVADESTSKTYWGEKMFYGGWEHSADDMRTVAFFEPVPDEEVDPYGKLW